MMKRYASTLKMPEYIWSEEHLWLTLACMMRQWKI